MLPNCLYSSHINFRGPAGTCSHRTPRICHAMPSLPLCIRIPKPDTSHRRLREGKEFRIGPVFVSPAGVTSKPVTVVRAPERARATALYSACAFWARLPAVARWLWRFPLHTMALGEVQRLCDVVFSAPAAPAGSGMAGCNKHGLNRLLFIISEIM